MDERHKAFCRTHLSAMAQLENLPRAIHLEIVDGDIPERGRPVGLDRLTGAEDSGNFCARGYAISAIPESIQGRHVSTGFRVPSRAIASVAPPGRRTAVYPQNRGYAVQEIPAGRNRFGHRHRG